MKSDSSGTSFLDSVFPGSFAMRQAAWTIAALCCLFASSGALGREVEFAGIGGVELPRFAVARLGSSGFGHGGYLTGVYWSADGNRVTSIGHGRSGHTTSVRVWNALTGQSLVSLAVPTYGRAIHNHGNLLLMTAPTDPRAKHSLQIIDLLSGKELKAIAYDRYINSSCLSPDGKLLAISHHDWTIALMDVATGRILKELPPLASKTNVAGYPQLQFSPAGDVLAICDSNYQFTFLSVRNPAAPVETWKPLAPGSWGKLVFGPDRTTAATIGGNGQIAVWDLAKGNSTASWKHGNVSGLDGSFSPDGVRLATCGADGYVRVWETATGAKLLEINTEERHPNAVAYSPDGKTLATGGGHGKVRLWDSATGKELPLTRDAPATGGAQSVAIDRGGKFVAVAGELGAVTLWELAPGKAGEVLPDDDLDNGVRFDPMVGPNWLAFTPAGDRLLAGSSNRHNSVNIWDHVKRERVLRLEGHVWPVMAVACSTGGKTYASASRDESIRLWDSAGTHLRTIEKGASRTLAIAPEGDLVASAVAGGAVNLWSTTTGELIRALALPEDKRGNVWPLCVSFSADSKRLAVSYNDGAVRIWDVAHGKKLAGYFEPADAQYRPGALKFDAIAWSPTEEVLAAAGSDGRVYLLDAATGARRATLIGHDAPVVSLAWHAGGKLLVSGGEDAVVYVWDTARAIKP
jgi:WD40 repeat protein